MAWHRSPRSRLPQTQGRALALPQFQLQALLDRALSAGRARIHPVRWRAGHDRRRSFVCQRPVWRERPARRAAGGRSRHPRRGTACVFHRQFQAALDRCRTQPPSDLAQPRPEGKRGALGRAAAVARDQSSGATATRRHSAAGASRPSRYAWAACAPSRSGRTRRSCFSRWPCSPASGCFAAAPAMGRADTACGRNTHL